MYKRAHTETLLLSLGGNKSSNEVTHHSTKESTGSRDALSSKGPFTSHMHKGPHCARLPTQPPLPRLWSVVSVVRLVDMKEKRPESQGKGKKNQQLCLTRALVLGRYETEGSKSKQRITKKTGIKEPCCCPSSFCRKGCWVKEDEMKMLLVLFACVGVQILIVQLKARPRCTAGTWPCLLSFARRWM